MWTSGGGLWVRQWYQSDVGSDVSIVLDDSRESDNANFRRDGFEVLPEVLGRQNLRRLIDPHEPEQEQEVQLSNRK